MIFILLLSISFSYTSKNEGEFHVMEFTHDETIDELRDDLPLKISGPEGVTITFGELVVNRKIVIVRVNILCINFTITNADEISVETLDRAFIFIENNIDIYSNNQQVYVPLLSHNFDTFIKLHDTKFIVKDSILAVESYNLQNAVLGFHFDDDIEIHSIVGSKSLISLEKVQKITFNKIEGDISIVDVNSNTDISFRSDSSFHNLTLVGGCSLSGKVNVDSFFLSQSNNGNRTLFISNAYLTSDYSFINDSDFISTMEFEIWIHDFPNASNLQNPNIIFNQIEAKGEIFFRNDMLVQFNKPLDFPIDTDSTYIIINTTMNLTKIKFYHSHLIILQKNDLPVLENLSSLLIFDKEANTYNIVIRSLFDHDVNDNNVNSNNNKNNDFDHSHLNHLTNEDSFYLLFDGNLSVTDDSNIEVSKHLFYYSNTENDVKLDVKFYNHNNGIIVHQKISSKLTLSSLVNCDFMELIDSPNVIIENIKNPSIFLTYNSGTPKITDDLANFTLSLLDIKNVPIFEKKIPSVNIINSSITLDNQTIANQIRKVYHSNISLNIPDFVFNTNELNILELSSNYSFSFGESSNGKIAYLNCSESLILEKSSRIYVDCIESQNLTVLCKSNSLLNINKSLQSKAIGFEIELETKSECYIENFTGSYYKISGEGTFYISNALITDDYFDFTKFYGTLLINSTQVIDLHYQLKLKEFGLINSRFDKNLFINTSNNDILIQTNKFLLYNSYVRIDHDISFDELGLADSTIISNQGGTTISADYFSFNGGNSLFHCDLKVKYGINNMTHIGSFMSSLPNFVNSSSLYMSTSTLYISDPNTRSFTFGENGFDADLYFYGKVELCHDSYYHLSNLQFFFSNIVFQENLIFDNKFDIPILKLSSGEGNNNDDDKIGDNNIEAEDDSIEIECSANYYVYLVLNNENIYASCSKRNHELSYYFANYCKEIDDNKITCKVNKKRFIRAKTDESNTAHAALAQFDGSNYTFDGVKMTLNDYNNATINLTIKNESKLIFNDRRDLVLDQVNVSEKSSLTIFSSYLRDSVLSIYNDSILTIYKSCDGIVNSIDIFNSTINCIDLTKITISYLNSKNSSFSNALINVNYNLSVKNKIELTNTQIVSLDPSKDSAAFYNIDYEGDQFSYIEVYGDSVFTGRVHVNGIFVCKDENLVIDLSNCDSFDPIVINNFNINCKIIFPQDNEILYMSGKSFLGEKTIFEPNNQTLYGGGNLTFQSFNLIKELIFNGDSIRFSEYSHISFPIKGNGDFIFDSPNVVLNKPFESLNVSKIIINHTIIFANGAIFRGNHSIDSFNKSSSKLNNETVDAKIISLHNIVFDKFSSYGINKVTIESPSILIFSSDKLNLPFDNVNENNLMTENIFSGENNDSKAEQYQKMFTQELSKYEWENIRIVATHDFEINIPFENIDFHSNDLILSNCDIKILCGSLLNINSINIINSKVEIKANLLESIYCSFNLTTFNDNHPTIKSRFIIFTKCNILAHAEFIGTESFIIEESFINLDDGLCHMPHFIFYENHANLLFNVELNPSDVQNYDVHDLASFQCPFNRLPKVKIANDQQVFNFTLSDDRVYFRYLRCQLGEEFSDNSCKKCQPGTYSSNDKCIKCPKGTYSGIGYHKCASCPINTYCSKDGCTQCTSCDENQITLYAGSQFKESCVCEVGYIQTSSGSCSKCFEGALCNKPSLHIQNLEVNKGYFITYNDNNEFNISNNSIDSAGIKIYQCPNKKNCNGLTCAEGSDGFLCAKCMKGYFHNSVNHCEKCPPKSMWLIFFVILGFLFHYSLVILIYFFAERYIQYFFIFMLFTQTCLSIHLYDVNWPKVVTVVMILFEWANLDFHHLFDCIADDEIWIQGYIFFAANIIYTFVLLFLLDSLRDYLGIIQNDIDIKNHKENQRQNQSGNFNDNGNADLKNLTDFFLNYGNDSDNSQQLKERKTRIIYFNFSLNTIMTIVRFCIIFFYSTFGIQLRWLLSCTCGNNYLKIYPYIQYSSKEYKNHIWLIVLNAIFLSFFSFVFIGSYFYFIFKKKLFQFFYLFGELVYDIRHKTILLPVLFIIKLLFLNFFVCFLNNSFSAFMLTFTLLAISTIFNAKFLPYMINYENITRFTCSLFEIFLVVISFFIRERTNSSYIISTIVFSISAIILLCVSIFCAVKTYLIQSKILKREEKIINLDNTTIINEKEVIIFYQNELVKFLNDKENDFSILIKWFSYQWTMYSYYKMRNILNFVETDPLYENDRKNLILVCELFQKYRGFLEEHYNNCSQKTKTTIDKFLFLFSKGQKHRKIAKKIHSSSSSE
ncbi:hypothetical protein TRFO_28125 [Tritrichomonas foetus]|uniref:DUF7630 domain-containing protein n=1 Tax=Tritrichomonas foetus TaxID=1144522 RepID=A0A1J4K4D9_9EUKA|nr:hypothetical protein TRFO_28125 [Tritrichomonas foetus]|eukprot:OHT04365.1 hypothetical protein TRFO_28125 [Tritrichomonas foetus]